MTNAVHVFNSCIFALHQTHLIANDYHLVLNLTDEEKASIPVEQLQSKDYFCEIESSAANLPFDCRFFTKADMAISRLDETVYSVPLLSEFSFMPEIMAYFLQGNSSSLFAGSLESLTADLSLHAKKEDQTANAYMLQSTCHIRTSSLAVMMRAFKNYCTK